MKNIPVFLGQNGTATLILREIPFSGKAYVLLRTVLPDCLSGLIQECGDFCRQCGAKTIFVSRDDDHTPLPLPHAYDILQLAVEKSTLPTGAPFPLVPMDETNDSIYLRIYNQCFQNVSHALSYDREQLRRIYHSGQQAFLALSEDGTPCGMGELHDSELAAVGLLPEHRGHGYDLTLSLLAHCEGPEITLTVASDNEPALGLYEKLGFHVTGMESAWYRLP
jgi:GNAT superfamily N-acetyltransferase